VILTRHTLDHIEVRADARELLGLAVPYGQPTQIGSYIESFARGAFAGIDAGSVPLTAAHPRDGAELPIGVSAELRESEAGLHGTWRVSRTQLGDGILALASDGVPLGLSIGFIAELDQWNRDRTRVVRQRASLDHISVVRSPAYARARVAAVRSHPEHAPLLHLARLHR
jgi:Escherichia/Staphylococcus phage prohead protease